MIYLLFRYNKQNDKRSRLQSLALKKQLLGAAKSKFIPITNNIIYSIASRNENANYFFIKNQNQLNKTSSPMISYEHVHFIVS